MAHELDLDDAVAQVSGDRARRELEELRAERDELRHRLETVCAKVEHWRYKCSPHKGHHCEYRKAVQAIKDCVNEVQTYREVSGE